MLKFVCYFKCNGIEIDQLDVYLFGINLGIGEKLLDYVIIIEKDYVFESIDD